jgi:hypothetical protein
MLALLFAIGAQARTCKVKIAVAYSDGETSTSGMTAAQQKFWSAEGKKHFAGVCIDAKNQEDGKTVTPPTQSRIKRENYFKSLPVVVMARRLHAAKAEDAVGKFADNIAAAFHDDDLKTIVMVEMDVSSGEAGVA